MRLRIGIVRCTPPASADGMRLDIEIETDAYDASVEKYLDTTVRPALAAGLTAAAEHVREDLTAELLASLDNPNPFTERAIAILPATFHYGDDPDAIVFVQPIQAQYLQLQIDGGVRRAGD